MRVHLSTRIDYLSNGTKKRLDAEVGSGVGGLGDLVGEEVDEFFGQSVAHLDVLVEAGCGLGCGSVDHDARRLVAVPDPALARQEDNLKFHDPSSQQSFCERLRK